MARLEWQKLLTGLRFSDRTSDAPLPLPTPEWAITGQRTNAERDFDRVLFATPVRRLADKTQVFPLDSNSSIRTRLTHSHEVANLARSIGIHLAHSFFPVIETAEKMPENYQRDIPAMLATVGLAHDIGNPPFGHSGEDGISHWFVRQCDKDKAFAAQFAELKQPDDFLKFEGNAHTLRLLTKLQVADRSFGFNLTMGTLAASMKYTVGSGDADHASAARKKYGFFETERTIAKEILAETGLSEGIRHPMAYIMEACDDIAYTVLDTEDMVKKRLVDFDGVMSYLEGTPDDIINYVVARSKIEREQHSHLDLSPRELDDVSMQKFRVHAIHAMVTQVIHAFATHYEDLMHGRMEGDLIERSAAAGLRRTLKEFDSRYAYNHPSVLKLQADGQVAIHRLMDPLWHGIMHHETDAKATAIYQRISENYRREYEKDKALGFYAQCRLLTDMVSGMTDRFTIDLGNELTGLT